jgi:hypothetical protein
MTPENVHRIVTLKALLTMKTTTQTIFVRSGLCLLPALYGAGAFVVRPSMFSDSGWGFAVWRSMQQGGPFNWLVQADPSDISRDAGEFLATWSPGQYLIPGWLTLSGFTLGSAIAITTLACSLVGLIGWYCLYRTFGFDEWVALGACAVVAMNRFFVLPFGIYNGGEILLFAATPFIMMAALWTWHKPSLWSLVLVPIFLFGFFLKNTALILALAICTALVLLSWREGGSHERRIGWLRWPAVFAATYLLAYVLYTSRGWTAVTFVPHIVDNALARAVFAVAAPMMSALSMDDALSWVLEHPGRQILQNWQLSLVIVAPLAFLACAAYVWIARLTRGRYFLVTSTFIASYIGIFVVLNVLGSAVSSWQEARHYRVVGLLLLPGLIEAARETRRRGAKAIVYGALLITCTYGLFSYGNKWFYLRGLHSVGTQAVTQVTLDREALQWILRMDAALPMKHAVFYLTSPEQALEVSRQRVILSQADFKAADILSASQYRGVVDDLFVILPDEFIASGKAGIILGSFVDYEHWDSETVGRFKIYQGYRR